MAETLATNGVHAPPQMITLSAALQVYAEMFQRLSMTRAGVTFAGARDIYETLGYKRDLRYEDYYARYRRGGIATRIVDIFPSNTWRVTPIVREKDSTDPAIQTPFEEAWSTLATRLRLWQLFPRADRLASLGYWAVLVLGLRGQIDWASEAMTVRSPEDVVYVKAFSQEHAKIHAMVSDAKSPLFGRPASYHIDFSRRPVGSERALDTMLLPALGGQFGAQVIVHASRVLHLAENGLEDDIVGTPALESVWNYLDDLEKLVGGTSEMTWQDAKRRIILSMDPSAPLPTGAEKEQLATEVDEFVHQLKNFLKVQGINVTQLEGKVPDASANVDRLLDLIAGTKGIPKRKLLGSERGELASTQDENNWVATIGERQQQYAEPVVLRPLIDRLIALGALPAPKTGYIIEWPSLLVTTEKERSEIAKNWAQTVATYAGSLGSSQDVLPLQVFLEDILEFPKDQVEEILEILAGAVAEDVATAEDPAVVEGGV